MGALDEHGSQRAAAAAGATGATFAGTLVVAGHSPAQAARRLAAPNTLGSSPISLRMAQAEVWSMPGMVSSRGHCVV